MLPYTLHLGAVYNNLYLRITIMQPIGLNDGPFLVFTFGVEGNVIIIEDHYENKFPRLTLDTHKSCLFLNAIKSLYKRDGNTSSTIQINSLWSVTINKNESLDNGIEYCITINAKDSINSSHHKYEVTGCLPKYSSDFLNVIDKLLHSFNG